MEKQNTGMAYIDPQEIPPPKLSDGWDPGAYARAVQKAEQIEWRIGDYVPAPRPDDTEGQKPVPKKTTPRHMLGLLGVEIARFFRQDCK